MDKDSINVTFADTIMERPYPFTVGHRQFYLYPVTLGKMFLLQRLMDTLQVNQENMSLDTNLEVLRLVREHRETCCEVLSYHTAKNDYESVTSYRNFVKRRNIFMKECTDSDLFTLMVIVLTSDKTQEFIKELGLDKEQDRKSMVMKVKDDKNNISFGGKSLIGSFIAPLMEIGFTKQEIVYERSYSFLRLMLMDKISSVYVSDEELKKLPRSVVEPPSVIKADDPNNKDIIKSMDWS